MGHITGQPAQKIYAVHYVYGPDTAAARGEHRPAHREYLLGLGADLVAAGAYVDDPEQALLLVRGTSAEDVRTRLAQDPFAVHGILAEARFHEWSCAIGTTSAVLRGEQS